MVKNKNNGVSLIFFIGTIIAFVICIIGIVQSTTDNFQLDKVCVAQFGHGSKLDIVKEGKIICTQPYFEETNNQTIVLKQKR